MSSITRPFLLQTPSFPPKSFHLFRKPPIVLPLSSSKNSNFTTFCTSNNHINFDNTYKIGDEATYAQQNEAANEWQFVQIKNPNSPPFISSWRSHFSLSDRAFFLFSFIALTASAAFVGFVTAAVPTLYAMGRAANSLAKLTDAAREELPGTMTAIRLSGIEISDLTLELSDLSQEVSDGVNKSAQVVKAAEVGIRHIGARAREQTMSIIQERANLSVVSGAAKKTSHAVGYAARTLMNFISGG